jgi:fructose-1,6-bisphosphatase/inositol monophosphatase family enzyme
VFISGAGPGLWDVCAGHCLVNELGGWMRYVDGEEILYSCDGGRHLHKSSIMTLSKNKLDLFLSKYLNGGIELK